MKPHVFNFSHITLSMLKPLRINFLAIIAIALVSILTSGCSYSVSTNLDEDNFTDYFSAGEVKIFKSLTELQKEVGQSYKSIGLIEGESCQIKQHHAAPGEVEARTAARKSAYQQGATAIVFSGCATIDNQMGNHTNQQCISTLVCYGQAYITDNVTIAPSESADH
jgi:RcsF protein